MTTYEFIMVAWAVLFAALGWVTLTQQSGRKNHKETTALNDPIQQGNRVTHY